MAINAFRNSATSLLGTDAIITNEAELGASLGHLLAGFQSGEFVPQELNYITIGANDFCSFDYNLNNLQDKLASLRSLLESDSFGDKKFVIVPPPNVPSLFDLTANSSLEIGRISYNCPAAVDLFEFCPRSGTMNAAEYLDLVSIYEQVFANSQNISVASLADISIEQQDIAADCFHPSQAGHEKIAANIYGPTESLLKSQYAKKIRKAGTDQCLYFMHRVSGLNLGPCEEAERYKWDLVFDSQGLQKYTIKNNLTEKCFFTRGEGVDLYQDTNCSHESSGMAFTLLQNSNGSFKLRSGEELCLSSTPDGSWNEIQAFACSNAENFDWVIE